MKFILKIGSLCLFVFMVCSSCQKPNQDISGNWKWNYTNEEGQEHQSEIILYTKDSINYIGQYCSVYNSGSKIDCSDDPKSINIVLHRTTWNQFEGTIQSNYSQETIPGQVEVLYSPKANSIFWDIKVEPDGEFYLPDEVLFFKN